MNFWKPGGAKNLSSRHIRTFSAPLPRLPRPSCICHFALINKSYENVDGNSFYNESKNCTECCFVVIGVISCSQPVIGYLGEILLAVLFCWKDQNLTKRFVENYIKLLINLLPTHAYLERIPKLSICSIVWVTLGTVTYSWCVESWSFRYLGRFRRTGFLIYKNQRYYLPSHLFCKIINLDVLINKHFPSFVSFNLNIDF